MSPGVTPGDCQHSVGGHRHDENINSELLIGILLIIILPGAIAKSSRSES